MGPVIAPPRAPERAGPGAAQALFLEARRRRRRRWRAGITAVLAASALVTAGTVSWRHGAAGGTGDRSGRGMTGAAGPSAVGAVWFDGAHLQTGEIGPGGRVTPRGGPEVSADLLPLVAAGGRVYWVNPMGGWVPPGAWYPSVVQYRDLATGRTGLVGAGNTAFLSADGRSLLMAQDASTLAALPVGGGALRRWALPHGWYLPGGDGLAELGFSGMATADGVVVQSRDGGSWRPQVLGLWRPGQRTVRVLGRGLAVIGSWTAPGAANSLVAWLPAGCRGAGRCVLRITSTATWATLTVPSPLPGGFAVGGAFSPDGSRLAVFPQTAPRGADPGYAELALADPRTGALRVALAPRIALGDDVSWALWLPGGQHLIVGGFPGGYLVDAGSLSARPLTLARGGGGRAVAGPDGLGLNFTAAVLPPVRQ